MEILAREEREKLIEKLLRGAEPQPLNWKGFLARVTAVRTRKKLKSGEEKMYTTYKLVIPSGIARELGLEPGEILGVRVARLKWYHLLDYEDPDVQHWFWRNKKLPPYARAEICQLGIAPEQLCRDYGAITVIASDEELKSLGLEPGQTVTLRELLERAKNQAG